MLNKDIHSRFEDWLVAPSETLDFEVKRWLDMNDPESRGLVAKTLIALENHGGGFLLFGYMEDAHKKLVPDPNRPASLEPYLSDAVNAVLKKWAEPTFHVEVTIQKHPQTNDEYPLVRVAGASKVPTRSAGATPKGTLKDNVYYIRAAGPESRAPIGGIEWDALIRRVVLNQREDIISILKAYLPRENRGSQDGTQLPELKLTEAQTTLYQSGVTEPIEGINRKTEADNKALLQSFTQKGESDWEALNASLDPGHPARIKNGHFTFSARIVGAPKSIPPKALLSSLVAARSYTGWPVFVTMNQEDTRAKFVDGCLQAWTAKSSMPDVSYADFWRIDLAGNFLLIRGYQEDSLGPDRKLGDPGMLVEATLPIWRVGEFLLRVTEVGSLMFDEDFDVLVDCRWTGLKGRHLFIHNGRRFLTGRYVSEQDVVHTSGTFKQGAIRDLLPETVRTLTDPLYQYFEFFRPPDDMYEEELQLLRKGNY